MSLNDRLVERFGAEHPGEAARALGAPSPAAAAALLSRLPEETAAPLLDRAAPPVGAAALAALDPGRGRALLGRLSRDRAAALLRRLGRDERERLLEELPDADRLRPLLTLPEDTAGALMDPAAVALPEGLDADEARRQLSRHAAHIALELYVVDHEQRLVGVVDLRDLLASTRRGTLAELARKVEPLPARADLVAIAAHPGWSDRGTLPVVDERGTFMGALRAERLRQRVASAEASRERAEHDAVLALGELFWLGLSGAFTGLARPDREEDER